MRIDGELYLLQTHKKNYISLLEQILLKYNIELTEDEKKIFTPEYELFSLFVDIKSQTLRTPGHISEFQLHSFSKDWLACCIAHRLAHFIYYKNHNSEYCNSNISLFEEMTTVKDINNDEEAKVDDITISILRKSGVNPNQLLTLFETAKQNLGRNNLNPKFDERLSNLKSQITRSK